MEDNWKKRNLKTHQLAAEEEEEEEEGSLYMPEEGFISKRGEFSETTAELVTTSSEQSAIKKITNLFLCYHRASPDKLTHVRLFMLLSHGASSTGEVRTVKGNAALPVI